MPNLFDQLSRELDAKSMEDPATLIGRDFDQLPPKHKEALRRALAARFPDPSQDVSNSLWKVVIWAFVLIMGGAALLLGVGIFVPPATGGTKPETLLAVFTAVTGFLAGLLSPSPVGRKSGR
ncbi:MAG TPA: hypothetical protein PLB02_03325 [Thermoanaerobaculia bacterium]|nr:hypothetical protein [Thermoanaerobaculia bacterium]HQR66404.1 hypothetical protein [Thermoanaerobaculia bacterium]